MSIINVLNSLTILDHSVILFLPAAVAGGWLLQLNGFKAASLRRVSERLSGFFEARPTGSFAYAMLIMTLSFGALAGLFLVERMDGLSSSGRTAGILFMVTMIMFLYALKGFMWSWLVRQVHAKLRRM